MTIKILITGSSGILGRATYTKFLNDQIFDTHGLVFSRNSDLKKIKCDLTKDNEVYSVLNSIEPDMIIHCAAERRPDAVAHDPENAKKLNVGSTQLLATWANDNNASVLYISSDYVFDGDHPPYNEEDIPNPLNDYGLMKLESEKLILNINSRNIVLRLPILYGDVEYIEECAVSILFKKVRDNSSTAPMSNFEKRYPTHCEDVAQTILNMVRYWNKDSEKLHGIFHYQSEEEMTKLDMALKMAETFGLPSSHLVQEPSSTGTELVKRPYKSELKCDKLKMLGLFHPTRNFIDGIKSSLKQFI